MKSVEGSALAYIGVLASVDLCVISGVEAEPFAGGPGVCDKGPGGPKGL